MPYPINSQEYATYQWLRREIGGHLAFGYNEATWDHEQSSKVDSIIQSGYMQMLYPPPLAGGDGKPPQAHTWSFLTPIARLELVANRNLYDLPANFAGVIGDFTAQAA